ncbi:MAG: aspartate aminotransferase family protein [Duodenibacillus sp.]|nr:aspartate aminotransferase family protein [Duodenibacillus sp.]
MSSHLLPIFSPLPICFERGDGLWLTDTEGKRYLDGFAGIAVNGVGHNHPRLVAALKDQVEHLIHCSNYFRIDLQEDVAAKICEKSGMRGCFFCNSGLEANEAAIKLARKYAHLKGITQPRIIVFDHAFHGRSIATLSATANAVVRRDFGPYTPDFVRVPAGDIKTIEKLAETLPGICAVMFEPVQGEGGICVIPDETMRAIRELCDKHDWLMILDEVQTGMGRTGKWFAFQHAGIMPDVMTLAKALGSGVPVGALVCSEKTYGIFTPGNHGSTFGGNPLAMRAAKTTISIMEDEKLVENAAVMGEYLQNEFRKALADVPGFVEVRGRGLMIGIVLDRLAHGCLALGLKHGVLFSVTAGNVIRIVPSLTIARRDADELVKRVTAVVREFTAA